MTENEKYIGKEIRKLSNSIKRAVPRCCEDEDITPANSWLIMYLYDHQEDDVFQRDIEQEFSIRRSTSSSIISLMEKKGYIDRVSVAHDARLKKLVLTEKALKLCEIINQNLFCFEEQLKSGISDEQLNIFYDILDKISQNVVANKN